MDTLLHHWVVLNDDDSGSFKSGQIIKVVNGGYVLIKLHVIDKKFDVPDIHKLFMMDELACETVFIFPTEEDYTKFIEWMNLPDKPDGKNFKLLHLKKEPKK